MQKYFTDKADHFITLTNVCHSQTLNGVLLVIVAVETVGVLVLQLLPSYSEGGALNIQTYRPTVNIEKF